MGQCWWLADQLAIQFGPTGTSWKQLIDLMQIHVAQRQQYILCVLFTIEYWALKKHRYLLTTALWALVKGVYFGLSNASEVFLIFTTQQYWCICNYNAAVFISWQEGSVVTGILPTPNISLSSLPVGSENPYWQTIYYGLVISEKGSILLMLFSIGNLFQMQNIRRTIWFMSKGYIQCRGW